MTSFRTPVLASGLLLSLLAGAALTGGAANAADLSVRPYMRAAQSAAKSTANPRGAMAAATGADVAALAPANAVTSQARVARAKFTEARARMDRAILLRDASAANVAMVEAATGGVIEEMKALERSTGSTDAAKKASALVQDWYQTGLVILKPQAGGVTELPMPTTVSRKADAAAAALDQLIEEASARATTPQRAVKRRPHAAPRPVASNAPATPSILPFLR
jgi:hypothetical protein